MTLSESPPTPLTASSTIGTIDFNDDEEDDVIGGDLATKVGSEGYNEPQGGGGTRSSSCALASSDRSTEKNTDSSGSNSYTDIGRKGTGAGENCGPVSAATAAAVTSDVNCAGKSIVTPSTPGLAPPASPVEGRGASAVEEAGVPLSEAFEGAGRRRFGSKSKRSVFHETSNDLLTLAAVHGDREGVSDGQGEPATVTSEAETCRLVITMPTNGHSTETGRDDADEHPGMSVKRLPPQSGEGLQMPPRSSTPRDAPFSSVGDHIEAGIEDSERKDSERKGSECKDSERQEYYSERNKSGREVDATGGERGRTDDPAEQLTEAVAASNSLPLQHPPADGDIDEDLAIVPIDEDPEHATLSATPSAGVMARESVTKPERSEVGDDAAHPPPPKSPPPLQPKRDGSDPGGDLARGPAVPSFSMGNDLQYPTFSVGDGGVSVSTGGFVGDELWMQSGMKSEGDRVTEAAEAGDVRAVAAFLDRGGNMEAKDSRLGATMLGWATRRGHQEMIRLLLDRGADVMARDDKLRTPLHRACTGCHADVVKMLLESGADPNARDKTRRSPLHRAARWGSPDCVLLLLDAGADIEARDQEMARTPLHYASRSGGVETTFMLLDNGADINEKTAFGNTALHLVCDRGLLENAKQLLEWGADATVPNAAGAVPVEVSSPWVEDSVKASLKELILRHIDEAGKEAAVTARRPTVVRPRPKGAAEAEWGFIKSIRSRRTSRAGHPDRRSGLRSARNIFEEDESDIGRISRGGSRLMSSSELRVAPLNRSRSQPGEGGLPGLDGSIGGTGEVFRSRRGLGSLRKQESRRLARAKRQQQQYQQVGGECHCTVQ